MRKGYLVPTLLAFLLSILSLAWADPVIRQIYYQKKTDLTYPKTYTLRFSLWDAETGGMEIWSEEKTVYLTSGTIRTSLGSKVPLNPAEFEHQLWVQVERYRAKTDDYVVIGTRDALGLVPYAMWSQTTGGMGDIVPSDTVTDLDGTFTAGSSTTYSRGDHKHGIGTGAITSTHILDGTIGFADIGQNGCSANQVMKWSGSSWLCAADANSGGDITSVTAGTGLSGGGTSGDVTLRVAVPLSLSSSIGSSVISGANSYASGSGLRGEASGEYGHGLFGLATGTSGTGIFGRAYNDGDVETYGGYFDSNGTRGRGVYARATNSGSGTNYGGIFEAFGTSGRGVYGYAPGGSGQGVRANGAAYDFYASGPGTNYGPFTGSHEVKLSSDFPKKFRPGMIVSVTGKTGIRKNGESEISLSSTLPTVALSKVARDKAVFGVLIKEAPLDEDHWYRPKDQERFGIVNALGEGRVWVSNINGDIEVGDYITTSSIPGYGERQDDDLVHSYTLGKAIEKVDWDTVTETIEFDGKRYKIYLIAVVYTSG